MREAGRFGLEAAEPSFRFERVLERVRERRAAIAPHDSQERFESLGVDVFRGSARFVSPFEIDVDGERLRGRFFVIATGSRAGLPAIPGLAEARPHTNESIFELEAKPQRMAVLGAGPIGCELGQAFSRLGVRVTMIEAAERALTREDPDAAALVQESLRREGVRFVTGATALRVSRDGAVARLDVRGPGGPSEVVEAEVVLVAAGRVPNTEGLGLEAAGVRFDEKGVFVDDYLATSQPHIFAAGDVARGFQFTHLADHHARVIVRNMLVPFAKTKVDTRALPWCTFTSPELARVGLSESQAAAQRIAHDVYRVDLREVDRAIVDGQETGFVKVLTARGTDRILGATVVAEHGGELVHELVVAMKAGIGLGALASTIHAYPTLSEAVRRIGDQYQKSRLSPLARRVFSWLYRRQRRRA
jgi:pyruvate/2-oxoglutarate dehydrogenase complex dihydrolipoamide dehydrogenase (E3) component